MVDSEARLTQPLRKRDLSDRRSPLIAAKLRAPTAPALVRERLDALLERVWSHRLCMVVAPAGSGKTTLVARFAAAAGASAAPVPVAWYRAEAWDDDPRTLLRYLESSLAGAIPELERGWEAIEDAAAALERWGGERVLLVVDDLHTLRGTAAEKDLARLIDYAPPSLVTLVATRALPDLDLSRLRVGGGLLEVGGDDLRFRLWEVERLFRDVYGEARPPEELAELARRTEGWAAGLQLFRLATEGWTAGERRRMLADLGHRSRMIRDYLTRNVLSQLPTELRDFLVLTGVLGRLTGPLCDALLGSAGSLDHLEELERRQVFISAIEEDGSYRYHEVLRAHLEQALVERLGEAGTRAHHRRAGELLEADGAVGDAMRAYARAEAWPDVARLLGHQGPRIAGGPPTWIDALPPALLASDPWLALATARRLRAEGRWAECVAAYQRAETTFEATEAGRLCHEERLGVEAWLATEPGRSLEGWGLMRQALREQPAAVAAMTPSGGAGLLAVALARLLAGDATGAAQALDAVAGSGSLSGSTEAAAGVARAGLDLAAEGARAASAVERAGAAAERVGAIWLARLSQAVMALSGTGAAIVGAEEVALESRRVQDPWGAALGDLFAGWGRLVAGEAAAEPLEQAAVQVAGLGAGTLEALARALAAVARARRAGTAGADDPDAPDARARLRAEAAEAVDAARRLSRRTGLLIGIAHTNLAAALLAGDDAEVHVEALRRAGLPGLDSVAAWAAGPEPRQTLAVGSSGVPASVAVEPAEAAPPVEVRLFGGLRVCVRGVAVDASTAKPRVRALLRHLAAASGRPVHREVLQEALWPEAGAEVGLRNLHVALSSLRQLLERTVPGGAALLHREGDAYVLALPPGSVCDLRDLEDSVAAGRRAAAAGDRASAIRHLRHALEPIAAELLPEDGPAEWVVLLRDRCRAVGVDAARLLAELLLAADDATGAAAACESGLALDRYADTLWRDLIEARERGGDHAAAERARQGYREVVEELGLEMPARLAR
jgi:DNA-binding SARP family transcriptional activator